MELIAAVLAVFFVFVVVPRWARKESDRKKVQSNYPPAGRSEQEVAQARDAIDARFDSKQGAISYKFEWVPVRTLFLRRPKRYLRFELTRNVAAMGDRQRECLRILYLLANEGLIDAKAFERIEFCLVWGDGKGTIEQANYDFRDYVTFRWSRTRRTVLHLGNAATGDAPGMIRAFASLEGATEESAVSEILSGFDAAEQKSPNSPAVYEIRKRLRGGGRFLDGRDLGGSIFAGGSDTALRIGALEDEVPFVYGGEGSLFTVAPPGSGKTQCHVIPNLLTYPGPVLVLDVKGECYENTSAWRRDHVGPVYRFNPLDPENSACYNPLTLVSDDPDAIWEDARFLASMLIVPEDANDPSWENRARDVVAAAIAWVVLQKPPDERVMDHIVDVISKVGWREFVQDLMNTIIVPPMRRMGNALADMPDKQLEGVLDAARRHLAVWEGSRVSRVMRRSDWVPLRLREKDYPSIYLCIPPGQIEMYASLLRVIIAQHIRALTAKLPPRGETPVLLMLDELPRLGEMDPVKEALETGRQYGLRLWMFAQSLGQMKDCYSNAEGMIGSCAVRIFMNPSLHDGTAQKLSEDLGHHESVLDGKRQPIAEPGALAGPEYENIQLVFGQNTRPARVLKQFAYADPELASRMGSSESR